MCQLILPTLGTERTATGPGASRARVAQTGVLPLRVPAAGFCLGTAQNVTPADFLQLEVFHLPCSSPALPSPVPASL